MRFQPKSEAEIAAEYLLAPGEYDVEVREANDKVSKAGNDMIHLKLAAFAADGSTVSLDDYLLESTARKLRRAAHAFGLEHEYEQGELTSYDFRGKAARAKIGIEKGRPKDDGSGESYSDKNRLLDYVLGAPAPAAPTARPAPAATSTPSRRSPPLPPAEADDDDDIPF